MINEKIVEALKLVHKRLTDKNLFWILSGSTSLVIQGVDVNINNDIDILTDEDGFYKIHELLSEFCVKRPEYSSKDKYRSYFVIYEISGVNVEVMGEFQYKLLNGEWSRPNHLNEIIAVDYLDMKIPILRLEQELVEYENMNRLDKVEKIRKKINKNHKELYEPLSL